MGVTQFSEPHAHPPTPYLPNSPLPTPHSPLPTLLAERSRSLRPGVLGYALRARFANAGSTQPTA
ncbi:MAG: hypothetical protein AAFP03_04375 [Cyanobacteria bacterium J06598_3]